MNMKQNEARWDRVARLFLGLAGVAAALAGLSPWGWLGLVLLATGATGWCPIYWACRVKTLKAQ